MAQLFNLKISDGIDTVDFLNTGEGCRVEDGGFDIGTPNTKRSFGVLRPGIGMQTQVTQSHREATIRFSVYGSTRSDIINSLIKVQQILNSADQRSKTGRGNRVDLQYSWEGAGKISYLEVYAGELITPGNVLSVENIHAQVGSYYVVSGLVLKLWLSTDAYAISVRSTTMTDIPLSGAHGSNVTSGLTVGNTTDNYAQISGAAIDGDTPVFTKIIVEPGGIYSEIYEMYIGLSRAPYATDKIYDSKNLVWNIGGSTVSGGYGGNHIERSWSSTIPYSGFYADWAWEYKNTVGLFYAFMVTTQQITPSDSISLAVGFDDYVTYGIRQVGDYYKPKGSLRGVPLGVIEMPPGPQELANKGTLHEDLWVGIFVAHNGDAGSLNMDYLQFLPINDGVRIWKVRKATLGAGQAVDDGWEGLEYVSGSGKIWTPWYGLLDPIKLIPGADQRLFFKTIGTGSEHTRQIKVKVKYVPTYRTMVE